MSKGSEPAYPVVGELMVVQNIGLTKRELYAAMAMQGFVACSPDPISSSGDLASESVKMADALIAALEGK